MSPFQAHQGVRPLSRSALLSPCVGVRHDLPLKAFTSALIFTFTRFRPQGLLGHTGMPLRRPMARVHFRYHRVRIAMLRGHGRHRRRKRKGSRLSCGGRASRADNPFKLATIPATVFGRANNVQIECVSAGKIGRSDSKIRSLFRTAARYSFTMFLMWGSRTRPISERRRRVIDSPRAFGT